MDFSRYKSIVQGVLVSDSKLLLASTWWADISELSGAKVSGDRLRVFPTGDDQIVSASTKGRLDHSHGKHLLL